MSEPILKGIRVVELATYIAGPAATVILGDFGADVIKIEAPSRPDPYRGANLRGGDSPKSPHPYGYIADNRNKRAIALDIKQTRGREIFDTMIQTADVFVTNMPIPTRERLSIGYESIKGLNKKIIYASISAYGEHGPEADRPGFDSTALWARTGLMDLVKPSPDSPPARSLPGMGDHPTAVSLFAAIMTGLYRRERTGEGSHVSTSLMANGVWLNALLAQAVLCGAEAKCRPPREDAQNPLHNLYQTRDGRWIHIVFNTNLHRWPEFVSLLGVAEAAQDPRFRSHESRMANNRALIALLETAFATRDYAEWVDVLTAHRFTFGDVRKTEEILTDPQMIEGGVLRSIDDRAAGTDYVVDTPLQIEQSPKVPPTMPPEFGEHTDTVLSELGFSEQHIAELRQTGVIS